MSIGESLPELPPDAPPELHALKMQLEQAMAEFEARLALLEGALSGGEVSPADYVWKTDATYGDFYPSRAPVTAEPPGIGTADASPLFLAVGRIEEDGVEGLLSFQSAVNGGGPSLMGYRGQDPSTLRADPDTLPDPNTLVTLNGVATYSTGPLVIGVDEPLADSHYVIAVPAIMNGQDVVVLQAGGKYTPGLENSAYDSRDIDLNDELEHTVVTLTLTDDFNQPDDTVYQWGLQLAELSARRSASYAIRIYVDGVQAGNDIPASRNGPTSLWEGDSGVLSAPLSSGSTIELRVEATKHHQQADPWVEGSVRSSEMILRQG